MSPKACFKALITTRFKAENIRTYSVIIFYFVNMPRFSEQGTCVLLGWGKRLAPQRDFLFKILLLLL